MHELVGELQRGDVNPRDDALGQTGLLRGLAHDAGGLDGALLGARVRADDDGVSRLEADQRLEDCRRCGVGGGDDGGDDAKGLGDLLVAERRVVLDNAAGLEVLVLVVDVLGGKVVLDDLVLHDAHAGLLHRHLGERNAGLVRSHGGRIEDLVHLLLGERGELRLGGAHLLDACCQRVHAVDDRSLLCHGTSISPVGEADSPAELDCRPYKRTR